MVGTGRDPETDAVIDQARREEPQRIVAGLAFGAEHCR
jgi:hypothetical protein